MSALSFIDDINFKNNDRKFKAFRFLISHQYENFKIKSSLQAIVKELKICNDGDLEKILSLLKISFSIIGRFDFLKKFPAKEKNFSISKWPEPISDINCIRELLVYCWLEILPQKEDDWKISLSEKFQSKIASALQNGSRLDLFDMLDVILRSGCVKHVQDLENCLPPDSFTCSDLFDNFKKVYNLKDDYWLSSTVFIEPLAISRINEDVFYDINGGLIVIVNDKDRRGSLADVNAIKDTFQVFQCNGKPLFDVIEHTFDDENKLYMSVEYYLSSSDYDCLVIFIMAHGDEENFHFKGIKVKKKSVMERFTSSNCPKLIKKPKLFFIQSCRGDRDAAGVITLPDNSKTIETDGPQDSSNSLPSTRLPQNRLVPDDIDFFVVNSTTEKYFAYRDTQKGSPFIQILCEQIKDHGHGRCINTIHTRFNSTYSRRLGDEYKKFVTAEAKTTLQKTLVLGRNCKR